MTVRQAPRVGARDVEMRVVDLLSYSSSHLSINGFWIAQLQRRGHFHIVAEAQHLEALAAATSGDLPVCPVRRRKGWNLWRELRFLLALFGYLGGPVFIMGATGLQILWLALLERVFPRQARRWLVVLHSEIEGVEGDRGVMKAVAGFTMRRLRFPKSAHCVVLGRHIKDNLRGLGLDSDRIHVIEHPLPALEPRPIPPVRKEGPRIAVVGLLRGDTKDLSVAAAVAGQAAASVSMIGRAGPGYEAQPGVQQFVVATHYTNDWMEDMLREVDVLLLCPAPGRYRYTALGSVGDAITYGRCAAWLTHDALAAYEDAPFAVCAHTPDELVRRVAAFDAPSQARVEQWMRAWNQNASRRIHLLWDRICALDRAS